MSKKFYVIFDNGGGTTLQVGKRGFVHHYDYPDQAARDVKVLLETGTTYGWEGHEPEGRMEYDFDMERNGGYQWHSEADIKKAIKDRKVERSYGYNMEKFYETLGVEVED